MKFHILPGKEPVRMAVIFAPGTGLGHQIGRPDVCSLDSQEAVQVPARLLPMPDFIHPGSRFAFQSPMNRMPFARA